MSKKRLELLLRWEACNQPPRIWKNEMKGLFNEKITSVPHTLWDGERKKIAARRVQAMYGKGLYVQLLKQRRSDELQNWLLKLKYQMAPQLQSLFIIKEDVINGITSASSPALPPGPYMIFGWFNLQLAGLTSSPHTKSILKSWLTVSGVHIWLLHPSPCPLSHSTLLHADWWEDESSWLEALSQSCSFV